MDGSWNGFFIDFGTILGASWSQVGSKSTYTYTYTCTYTYTYTYTYMHIRLPPLGGEPGVGVYSVLLPKMVPSYPPSQPPQGVSYFCPGQLRPPSKIVPKTRTPPGPLLIRFWIRILIILRPKMDSKCILNSYLCQAWFHS